MIFSVFYILCPGAESSLHRLTQNLAKFWISNRFSRYKIFDCTYRLQLFLLVLSWTSLLLHDQLTFSHHMRSVFECRTFLNLSSRPLLATKFFPISPWSSAKILDFSWSTGFDKGTPISHCCVNHKNKASLTFSKSEVVMVFQLGVFYMFSKFLFILHPVTYSWNNDIIFRCHTL